MTNVAISDQEYRDFCKHLESKCGIVLGDSKQYLVRSRLSPLVNKFGLTSLSELVKSVVTGRNRELAVTAIDAMTTNETLWFRDTYPYEVLAHRILRSWRRHASRSRFGHRPAHRDKSLIPLP